MKGSKLYVFLLILIFTLTSAAFADSLKYGSRGADVIKLQQFDHYASIPLSSRGSIFSIRQATGAGQVNANKQEVQLEDSVGEPDEAASADEEDRVAESVETKEPKEQDDNRKIEVLDWWKAANQVFARGSKAKVIDVRTGKSFYIKRTYGANHADCETLTKEDTKIMKDIWGGFNWSRRPVLVEIDGRLLAASMSGMPHAGLDSKPTNAIVSSRSEGYGRGYNLDAVKNNGMNGHFDIHFKNSRTHGSNRIDPAHQRAIREAAAARLK